MSDEAVYRAAPATPGLLITLPEGLETSGRRAYCLYWDLGKQDLVWSFGMIFSCLKTLGFWVFANTPTLHSGGSY